MKTLTDRVQEVSTNERQARYDRWRQDFQIQAEDIGLEKVHFLGYGGRPYRFLTGDLGRKIRVYSGASGWTCWRFLTEEES